MVSFRSMTLWTFAGAIAGCAPAMSPQTPQTAKATLGIAPASAPQRQVLTLGAHSWVASDVVEYDVSLDIASGSVYLPMSPAKSATTSPTVGTVSFSNLMTGNLYEALVTAKGNPGGVATSALSVMNATAATAVFDFSSSSASQSKVATVVFDAVPFAATETTSLGVATDGVWLAPATSVNILTGP